MTNQFLAAADAMTRAQRAYDAQEPPEDQDVSGEFSVETDGLIVEGVYLGADDGAEIHWISTVNETVHVGGMSHTLDNILRCREFTKLAMRHSEKHFREAVARLAVAQLRAGGDL
jgi:hypothetical protein